MNRATQTSLGGSALHRFFLLGLLALTTILVGIAAPVPTATHPQLVHRFFTTTDGLPADDVRAVAVNRDGAVITASAGVVARLQGDRWSRETGPQQAVTALFACERLGMVVTFPRPK